VSAGKVGFSHLALQAGTAAGRQSIDFKALRKIALCRHRPSAVQLFDSFDLRLKSIIGFCPHPLSAVQIMLIPVIWR
jgi:hypothetical protein